MRDNNDYQLGTRSSSHLPREKVLADAEAYAQTLPKARGTDQLKSRATSTQRA